MNSKSHCSIAYHFLSPEEVEPFGLGVKAAYYGNNPPFTDVTLTEADFGLLVSTFAAKRADYINGGEVQKGPYLLAKTALMQGLDTLAGKVDIVADGNTEIITLGGFDPTKTGKSEGVKPGQCMVTVKRGITGELIASCALVPGTKHYGCIMVEGSPLPQDFTINADGKIIWQQKNNPQMLNQPEPNITGVWIDLTDQRIKHFTGLKHDAVYYFYYYAVNATGVGPLSEVVSMVAW